jgi:membrane fusion protein, heavy metal efflux system
MKKPLFFRLSWLLPALLLLPAARAHEGHDAPGGTPLTIPAGRADEVVLPKESQFLFEILTQPVQADTLHFQRALLGEVVAAPGGAGQVVAPQGGRLREVRVRVGEGVRAGQVVAVLDQTLDAPAELALAASQAAAQAELRAAEQEVARLQAIADLAARKDVVAAELRLRQARRQATIQAGQTRIRRLNLIAPISGTVEGFALAAGQQVSAGQLLLSIIDPARLTVTAQVLAADQADAVAPDAVFEVTGLQGETPTIAQRVAFSNVVNSANQARQLVLSLASSGAWRVGQRISVRVRRRANDAQLAVPTTALTDVNGQPAVFVHVAPEVFALRYVRLGAADEVRTTIAAGLQAGERVVTKNTYQLKAVYLSQ